MEFEGENQGQSGLSKEGSDVLAGRLSETSDRGGIITARGTGEGLVVRLDGRVDLESLRAAITEFMTARKSFLSGNDVALEWVGEVPSVAVVEEVTDLLEREFSVTVSDSRLREQVKVSIASTEGTASSGSRFEAARGASNAFSSRATEGKSLAGGKAGSVGSATSAGKGSMSGKRSSLFDGIEAIQVGQDAIDPGERSRLGTDPALWDDPDARIVYATLRSGQKVESEHTVVVCGDVNSGAEVIAGGDIIVLGALRGVAHAGAYDETGGGRFIFALNLQPTQLRIGTVISRGSSDSRALPEIARVDGSLIVVEPYQSKSVLGRKI